MKKISIYLVEDYFLLRSNCKNELNKISDFEVTRDFETAEDCIKALEIEHPDIILMDLGLPSMNGIEATKIINEKYKDIKIIILTSHEERKEVLACISSGACGYMLKDHKYDNLANVIRMVNNGALWFDPQFENIAKEAMPKPNSTDFENLYDTELDRVLTEKEFKVLEFLAKGKSNTEIADIMHVSMNTIKSHVSSILTKLCVTDRVQAAVKATKAGIV